MTPAEHAATVRGSMREDMRDRGDCPERSGVCWCRQNAAHDALDKIVALAERATELEAELAKVREGRDVDRLILEGFRDKAEARATELERERDEREAAADVEHEAMVARYKRERERAERAETALRDARKLIAEHHAIGAMDDLRWGGRCPVCEAWPSLARAALGETAP